MKQHIKNISFVVGSLCAALSLAAVPVSAQHGQDDTVSAMAVTDSSTSTSNTSSRSGRPTVADDSTSTSASETETETELHAQAAQLLQSKRATAKQHTQAERQKACDLRQNSLNVRSTAYAAAAQRHLDTFNTIFTKVQNFETSKQLTAQNYDTLVATAKAKQTAAQTAVDSLKALDVKIDCTQTDPATTVANLKSAVADARTALQAYRSSIKDVIVALQSASSNANTSTSTSTTTTTTSKGGTE